MNWTDLGKFVAGLIVAGGGLFTIYSNWEKLVGDKVASCENRRLALFKQRDREADLGLMQEALLSDIDTYQTHCKVKLPDKTIRILLNSVQSKGADPDTSKGIVEPPALEPSSQDVKVVPPKDLAIVKKTSQKDNSSQNSDGQEGWAALGKVGGTYGQINFEGIDLSSVANVPTSFDQPLRAKWPVYLRANTNNTKQGNNPVVSTIAEGACVLPSSTHFLRGQIWAKVKLVGC